jgi:anti-anti-sigma factor
VIGSWLAGTGVETSRMVDEGRPEIRSIDNDLFGGRVEPDIVFTTLRVEVRQTRLFDEAAVAGMIACHPGVVQIDPLHDDRRLRIVPTYTPRGLRIAGTVDVMTAGAFNTTLELATRWPDSEIQLDLGELEFIDVCGVRTIMRTARTLEAGRRLVVTRLAGSLRRVFGVVGWHRTPGLCFAGEEGA